MQTEELIIKLKEEFEFIKDDVEGIVLYGSGKIGKWLETRGQVSKS